MRLKFLAILALTGAVVLGPSATAHDLLVDINPAEASVLTEGSFDAKLIFNNPLLAIAGETNAQLATKPTASNDWTEHRVLVSDRVLTARVVLIEPGTYDLRWKVVSSDGHPISGTSSFTLEIASSGESSSDSSGESAAGTSSPESESPKESEQSMLGFYAGLAMVVLGVIFAPIGLVMRRRAMRS